MGKVVELFQGMEEKQMPSIFDVANYFVSQGNIGEGSTITPLKVQKLCYYAQAWSLVWDSEPLFANEFEAWAHGPANHDLFVKYREYGYHPILVRSTFNSKLFTESQTETLNAIWDAYGIYEAKYLEDLTHQEEPWIAARKNCCPGEKCNNIITLESMQQFYSTLT